MRWYPPSAIRLASRHAAELGGELECQVVQLVVVLGFRGCRDRVAERAGGAVAAVADPERIADAGIEWSRPPVGCDRHSLDHEHATRALTCEREELTELVAAPGGSQVSFGEH